MRCTVLLAHDELTTALTRALAVLQVHGGRIDQLTVTRGRACRLTARFPAGATSTDVDRFVREIGGRQVERAPARPATVEPFHWQADGAGDLRVG